MAGFRLTLLGKLKHIDHINIMPPVQGCLFNQYVVFLMSARITARFTMYRFMMIHNVQIYLEHVSYLFMFLPVPGVYVKSIGYGFDVYKDHC